MRTSSGSIVLALLVACPAKQTPAVGGSSSGSIDSTSEVIGGDSEGSTTSSHSTSQADERTGSDGSSSTSGAHDGGSTTGSSCMVDPTEPPTCSSRTLWTDGDSASTLMRPGAACNACHLENGGAPVFVVAGTVYPTLHEPDDCYGAAGSDGAVVVRVTGSDGATIDLPVSTSGNFFASSSSGIVFPIFAEVVTDDGVLAMCGWQADGDCNGCHTQEGANGAPGRVRLP